MSTRVARSAARARRRKEIPSSGGKVVSATATNTVCPSTSPETIFATNNHIIPPIDGKGQLCRRCVDANERIQAAEQLAEGLERQRERLKSELRHACRLSTETESAYEQLEERCTELETHCSMKEGELVSLNEALKDEKMVSNAAKLALSVAKEQIQSAQIDQQHFRRTRQELETSRRAESEILLKYSQTEQELQELKLCAASLRDQVHELEESSMALEAVAAERALELAEAQAEIQRTHEEAPTSAATNAELRLKPDFARDIIVSPLLSSSGLTPSEQKKDGTSDMPSALAPESPPTQPPQPTKPKIMVVNVSAQTLVQTTEEPPPIGRQEAAQALVALARFIGPSLVPLLLALLMLVTFVSFSLMIAFLGRDTATDGATTATGTAAAATAAAAAAANVVAAEGKFSVRPT